MDVGKCGRLYVLHFELVAHLRFIDLDIGLTPAVGGTRARNLFSLFKDASKVLAADSLPVASLAVCRVSLRRAFRIHSDLLSCCCPAVERGATWLLPSIFNCTIVNLLAVFAL
jgi:hypothetical protein